LDIYIFLRLCLVSWLLEGEHSYIRVWDLRKTWANISLGTWSLGEGDIKQEEIGRGQKEGKETSSRVKIRNVGQGKCSHSILERSRAWLGCGIPSSDSNDFHSNNPNWGRTCNYKSLGVLFSTTTSEKTIGVNYT